MPRKTAAVVRLPVGRHSASMRPRPDAAENEMFRAAQAAARALQ